MAGRYIINQTAGKRVVILDEDNDKVEGGYFDTDGNWISFEGMPKKLYKVKKNETVETSTKCFPVWGSLYNFSNWSQVDVPAVALSFPQTQGGVGCSCTAIRNNAITTAYLTNGTSGEIETTVNENTRLEIYIPEDFMDVALRALEEVTE